jgi:hypothetical protein
LVPFASTHRFPAFLIANIAIFHHYFPKTEGYYSQVTHSVSKTSSIRVEDLSLPIPEVPFTSYTFNVGARSVCEPHIDGSNYSAGLCLVSPFGTFNHKSGGHLILHDLKLVFEVAPGSICLIPSAIITHSNIGISLGETRRAITAYTPGAYFQYYEEDFGRVPERSDTETEQLGQKRWSAGKARFPHVDDLC